MNTHNILGLGSDLIEIERIEKTLQNHRERFLHRLFTKKEQAYCLRKAHPPLHLAGRFSAKEAIAKALGCGFGKDLSFLDLEILNDERGKPLVTCSPSLNHRFNNPHFLLSISHTKLIAMSTAIYIPA